MSQKRKVSVEEEISDQLEEAYSLTHKKKRSKNWTAEEDLAIARSYSQLNFVAQKNNLLHTQSKFVAHSNTFIEQLLKFLILKRRV